MRNRRVSDQLLHVALRQRDKARVNDRDHRKAEHNPHQLRRRIGEHRHHETDEAISAELQEHARQDHRARGRRLDVRVGKPGVDRPHRHLHCKAGEEGQPQPGLHRRREVIAEQRRNVGRARFGDHRDHRDQHQHRSEQRVEEEFIRRIFAVRAAPDPDNEIHRDQASFKEDVEQQQILRAEHADHDRFHDQEHRHVQADATLDRVPARQDTQRHQENAEHDQHQRHAVDAQRPAEPSEQVSALGKLPLRPADVELCPHHAAQHKSDQRRTKRDPARRLVAHEQASNGGDRGDRQHQRKDRKTAHRNFTMAQLARPTSPSSITNAYP